MYLKVNDIFYSLQGETSRAGFPSVFIRLSGCNLRCSYCDTKKAWTEGDDMKMEDILMEMENFRSPHHVTITGGEPLIQENTYRLMDLLIQKGYDTQLETNGSISLARVQEKIKKIVDVKTPSTLEAGSFLTDNLNYITPGDEIKFLIADRDDYIFSKEFISSHLFDKKCVINLSPVFGRISYKILSNYILSDGLKVRLNLQLHKIIDIK